MQAHTCHLTGLILLPSQQYPTGSLSAIAPSSLIDSLNTRLVSPILLTQQFLPLLSANKHGNSGSIILLNPSIPRSLSLPYSIPEITSTTALSGFAGSLRRELQQQTASKPSIAVTEIHLGNIDLGSQYTRQPSVTSAPSSSGAAPSSAEVLSWDLATRAQFATSAPSSSSSRSRSTSPRSSKSHAPSAKWSLSPFKPTPARDLHIAIYDSLRRASSTSGRDTIFVGRGSWSYGVVGRWAPAGLVGLMLRRTFRDVDEESGGFGAGWGSGSETWEQV